MMKRSKKLFTLLLAVLLLAIPVAAQADGEVTKLTIEVKDQSFAYNGKSHTVSVTLDPANPSAADYFTLTGALQEGHRLEVTISGERKNAGSEKLTAEAVVYDATATTSTVVPEGQYAIEILPGNLIVNPCKITVQPKAVTATYDGNEHKATEIEDVALAHDNHVISSFAFENAGTRTDAGTSKSTIDKNSIVIVNRNQEQMQKNYDISVAEGAVTVEKRSASVTIPAASKVYDGTALAINPTYEGLLDSHSLTVGAEGGLINAGTKTPKVTIRDNSNNDVTDNYDIGLQSGTLEVEKAEIRLTSESKSKRYDGTALTAPTVTIEGTDTAKTVFAKEATVTATGTQTEVGSSENTITITPNAGDIYNEGNYAITTTKGTLTVTADDRTSFKVTPKNISIAYDGSAHKASENPVAGTDYEIDTILPSHHQLVVTLASEEITDVGTKTITVTGARVLDISNNNADITAQYNIDTTGTAVLTVTKAQVTLTSPTVEKVYDGTPLTAPNVTVSGTGAEIFNAEANAVATASETHVYRPESGEFDPDIAKEKNSIIINAKANSNYKETNYDITKVEGTLLIKPIEITVTSKPIEKKYDGKPLTNNGTAPEITWGSFLFKDNIDCIFTESRTDAGANENGNDFGYTFVPGPNSPSKEDDYEITKVVGTMQVHRRELKLISGTAKKTYDGKKLVCQEVTIKGDGMASGEKIYFSDFSSKTSVGKRDNKFKYSFSDNVKLNSDGDPINYNVTVKYGELKVSASGSSTQTGRDDHWPMMLGISALFIAAGIGIAVALKKRNSRNDG